MAGGWHGKKPHFIDECEAACLEDAAICLDAVGDELRACLSSDEDWRVCFEAAKVGAEACATQAKLCLTACDD